MEKRGEVLNQLAIMSDLLENINLESESTNVVFVLGRKEFKRIYDMIIKEIKVKSEEPDTTFSMRVGEIEFVFNLNKNSA